MRHRLLFAYVALLALAACDQRPASKTEIAAKSSAPIAAAPAQACPPQPAPVCPPAKVKAKHVARHVRHRRHVRRAAPAEPRYAQRESHYESYEQQSVSEGGCCVSAGAAGFDGYGYLTWPGKVPAIH
jgi:uncharacterized membrane protein